MKQFETNKTSIVPQSSIIPEVMNSSDDGIDLLEYLQIIRRHWFMVIVCILLSIGIASFLTYRMTKIYRGTTTIRIETQAPQVLGRSVEDVVELGTGSFWSNVEYYETQYKIIESRKTALNVVEEFNLHNSIDFMELPEEKLPASKEDAAKKLQSMLTIEPVKDSRLVMIHIDHKSPEKAQLFADSVARAYVAQNLEIMHNRTLEAVDWLSERLDQANENLVNAENELFKYKKENNILSISLEDRQSHLTGQMQTAAQNLTQAKAKRIELQARKRAISRVANMDDPMAIPINALNENPLIQQLKQNYATLSQEWGELSARYGESFPKMVELKGRLERINSDIKREVNNVIRAIDAELNEAMLTEAGLAGALEELEEQAQKIADNKGMYNDLDRRVINNEQVYQLLKGRSEEAKLSRFLKVNNVEILDHALLPEHPIKPRVALNLALAGIIGIILGIGLVIIVELADRTIKTQEEVEALGVSFLGIVPSIDTAGNHSYNNSSKKKKKKKIKQDATQVVNYDNFVFDNPKSQVAESLRSIRTNILFMTTDQTFKKLLVTSPSPQEGKTTVATNLAIIMAQSGMRVLLVDTDMRRPRVHKAFDISRPTKGISTMLLGQTTAEESIFHSRIPNLDVLVCGPTPPNPAELIHTDAFKRVVDNLSSMYDRVIFDSPPVGIVTDAAILSTIVDGTVLILKSLKTTKDAASYAVGILKDIDSPILGAVLNDLDLSNKKYGQYYYYYYNRYGYYYGEDQPGTEKKASKKKALTA